jgi:hypothetical protein
MTDNPHKLAFSDQFRRRMERVAALLDLESWRHAIGFGSDLALRCAEQSVKGKTHVVYVTEEFAKVFEGNEKFLDALCEEGVVEWLTPLVLAGSKGRAKE